MTRRSDPLAGGLFGTGEVAELVRDARACALETSDAPPLFAGDDLRALLVLAEQSTDADRAAVVDMRTWAESHGR
jgi:hypothetical protein